MRPNLNPPLSVVYGTTPHEFVPACLRFDEELHQYAYAGVRTPSVTQIMEGLHSFANVPWDVLEAAQERGRNVHLACQYWDEDDLDEDGLTPQVRGYLAGWKRFVLDSEPEWTAIEQPIMHMGLRYAGTPDRFGAFTIKGERIEAGQVDIKTAVAAHPCWGVQTIAYNHAAGLPNARRFTVQLREDGSYRLLEWTDPQDWPVFVSLTTLRTWKERNSL